MAHARHTTPVIRSERAAKSGQAKNYAAYFLWQVWEDGIIMGHGGAWYGVVGTLVGRLTPPSRMGKKGKGKKGNPKVGTD